MKSLEALRSGFVRLCERVDPGRSLHPSVRAFHTAPQHNGSPHVEIIGQSYQYVVTERGSEFERKSTTDPDELLYWLLSDVTFSFACDFELHHRKPGVDSRRFMFAKQLELLSLLSASWADRCRVDITRILSNHPYRDENAVQQ